MTNCLHFIHRDGRRSKVDRPCLLPTSGRIEWAPRICRSSRIQLVRELRAMREPHESIFATPDELAKFLANWERNSDDFGPDTVTALDWEGQLAIVTSGSPEFVERQLAEQAGFDDAILATHRTWDGVASCVVIGWSMTVDAIRILNRELNRTTAEGRAT